MLILTRRGISIYRPSWPNLYVLNEESALVSLSSMGPAKVGRQELEKQSVDYVRNSGSQLHPDSG